MKFRNILVSLLFISSICSASPRVEANVDEINRAARVLDRLLSTISDTKQNNISLIIDPSNSINAMAYFPDTIVVNKGMLRGADDDMLAVVLGHELGHHRFGDVLVPNVLMSAAGQRFREAKADSYGINVANRAGFDGCGGAKRLFKWFVRLDGGRKQNPNSDHPSSQQRLEAAIKQCGG